MKFSLHKKNHYGQKECGNLMLLCVFINALILSDFPMTVCTCVQLLLS